MEKENEIDIKQVTSKTKRGLSGNDLILFKRRLL